MNRAQIFKIGALLLALVGVVYAMRAMQSQNFVSEVSAPSNPLSLMLGAELRPMNWCPEKAEKLELVSPARIFVDAPSISRFCEVMIEPVTEDDVKISDYQLVATASGSGSEKKLERNSKFVFRVGGFPFHSKQLEKQF